MEKKDIDNEIRKVLKEYDISVMDAFIAGITGFGILTKYIANKNLHAQDLIDFIEQKYPESLLNITLLMNIRGRLMVSKNNYSHQSDTSEKRSEPSQETKEND